MKDLGLMALGVAIFSVIVYGAVTAGAESSDGSNTRNGVTQPALPQGVDAPHQRNTVSTQR